MNNLYKYANKFFDELEVFQDTENGHSYKIFLRQSILEFLENETKDTAFAVYTAFFDSYRITIKGKGNTFIDLLDVLRSYEENAATLIDKQRDHYIHSVNVFILGLCIYTQNVKYRAAFDKTNLDKNLYPYSYETKHEEFFYRWGVAALFHDIGYPVEIIGKQITKFINLATNVDQDAKINPHLEFDNFSALNSITEIIPKKWFTQSYFERYDSCVYVDLLKPIDLLAHKIHLTLGADLKTTKNALDNFVNVMSKSGFIDHGFYSAIIVLKWYGYLLQSCKEKPEYFYFPILDSASAILLHNYYRNALMKAPFELGAMTPQSHPIAFLLILCDELQEWNRTAYGIVDKQRNHICDLVFAVDDQRMDITYLVPCGPFPDCFAKDKEELLNSVLDLKSIFIKDITIGCEMKDQLSQLVGLEARDKATLPRPLLENLEKLAIAIHDRYNQLQKEMYPDQPLKSPRFSDHPETLKYSNLRQARSIAKMLELINCEMRPKDSPGEKVDVLETDTVEYLARFEHDEWVRERLSSGWVFGKIKDVDNKISPYLIPYHELDDDIKEFDRDTVRNIPTLLEMIGMSIFKR